MEQVFTGSTFGEITEKGFANLIDIFSDQFNNPNGVFYDLGSGYGSLCIQAAKSTKIGKSIGIELHRERCKKASQKLENLDLVNVSFINEDLHKSNLSDATIILSSNEAMPSHLNSDIYEMAPKGCLIILGAQPDRKWLKRNPNVIFNKTEAIEKTYSTVRGNWYIIKN
tara:strand:- start:101 stop:607 length:507 start_codon:yes stop_codon:yes gene_type:complete